VVVRGGDRSLATLQCDGVLLTGHFVPEAALVGASHLDLDPGSGGPVVDQYGRCSDPSWFAAGNVLRPAETAGWSFREGHRIGLRVAEDLFGRLPAATCTASVARSSGLKVVVAQRLALPFAGGALDSFQVRERAGGGHSSSCCGRPTPVDAVGQTVSRAACADISSKPVDSQDVKVLHHMGYAQELARRMHVFSNFAISFSIICILAGGITAFPVAFSAGGPLSVVVGWAIGGLFAFVVGCSMAQIASAYPTAGGLYHWASILGGRGYGWVCAWINLLGLLFVVATVNVGAYLLFKDLVLTGVLGLDTSAWGLREQAIA
jgi:Amino acid permease